MGDPAGYLDEGKGLPWITMDCLRRMVDSYIVRAVDAAPPLVPRPDDV